VIKEQIIIAARITLALTISLQQKAVKQFTNVYEYLSKSGPIPLKWLFTAA